VWEWAAFSVAATLMLVGQATQNISLPLALSDDIDMSVFLVYTAFMYFIFFTVADILMELALSVLNVPLHVTDVSHKKLAVTGLHFACNGIGAVFGGSSTRTPLPVQMIFALISTLFAPMYKSLRLRIHPRSIYEALTKRERWSYALVWTLYLVAMILVVVNKVQNTGAGSGNAFMLFFIVGTIAGMTYNVEQDICMKDATTEKLQSGVATRATHQDLNLLLFAKRDMELLRRMNAWLFLFSWISVILSLVGASQGGPLTTEKFLHSWGKLLSFGNVWMDIFNLGQIVTLLAGIYLNRFDSVFTNIIGNVSSVSAMWTGWVPAIAMQTVGFSPSVPMTVIAMILSLVAIVPSVTFGKAFHRAITKIQNEDLQMPLLIS